MVKNYKNKYTLLKSKLNKYVKRAETLKDEIKIERLLNMKIQ